MKNLMQFVSESLIYEGRSILDQPEWGEPDDIKYLSKAADQMEQVGSLDLKKIMGLKVSEVSEYFLVYRTMIHCFQDIIDNCLDSHELSEEVQEELGTFAVFNKFKLTGYYEKVSDSYLEDYNGDADKIIKHMCDKWNDICKKATGNYWW